MDPIFASMDGEKILVRSMTKARIKAKHDNLWQYNSWSDRHSRVACWGVLFDLLQNCPLLQTHAREGKVGFGINHPMTDFTSDRTKDLDLVICIPGEGATAPRPDFAELVTEYGVVLTPEEQAVLRGLPPLKQQPVGDVLLALEAKACMTAHQKAGPRLFDELTSAWQCINGSSPHAIAVGHALVNASEAFISPKRNPWSIAGMNAASVAGEPAVWNHEPQPRRAVGAQERAKSVRVRGHTNERGYDATGITTIVCRNDYSPVTLADVPPALGPNDPHHYAQMIRRVAGLYDGRFANR